MRYVRRSTIDTFMMRELAQAAWLRRALRGRYQKTFHHTREELARLRRDRVCLLLSHNPSSRCRWLRAVVARLGPPVGAHPPGYVLRRPLYLVTVIDRRQIIDPDLELNSRKENPTWEAMRSAYRAHLRGFDYVGMLDAALFVSAQRAFMKNRLVCVHLHALVWNTDEAALEAAGVRVQRVIRPLFSYTHAFDFRPVNASDFLQVAWYVYKTPRKQYQVHYRETHRWRQYKRDINGVNSVRLYQIMRDVTLDQLALADGEGIRVLKKVLRDVQRP